MLSGSAGEHHCRVLVYVVGVYLALQDHEQVEKQKLCAISVVSVSPWWTTTRKGIHH